MTIQPRKLVRGMSLYEAPEEDRAQYVRLDFNENTSGFASLLPAALAPQLNIYPEYKDAIRQFAGAFGVTEDRLLLTNGSDEALSLIAQTFVEPGVDCAITSTPSFSMIGRSLLLAGAQLFEVPTLNDLKFDLARLEDEIAARSPKLAIFASPDNPTGSLLPLATVRNWCAKFPDTLLVIDEAYAEYAGQTVLPFTGEFGNLLVTRTLSKAWGLAGLRLGLIIGPTELLRPIQAVRLPYSVNSAAVKAAGALLPQRDRVDRAARETMQRKDYVVDQLRMRGFEVNAGNANFFLLNAGNDAARLCAYLKDLGILVRNRSQGESQERSASQERFASQEVHNSQGQPAWSADNLSASKTATREGNPMWGMIRITVGTESENALLLKAIDEFSSNGDTPRTASERTGRPRSMSFETASERTGRPRSMKSFLPRSGAFARDSKETQVKVVIDIDSGSGKNGINTPLPFFSHMLDAFSCHGRFNLNIDGTGDIEVDPHHFIEDTGIVLGRAFREALGGYSGVVRAGCFSFPMDCTIASVAVDLCGRANLVWNVKFGYHTVGNLDPNLFREFFKGFVDGLGATIHVNVPYSDNDHHAIEAIFKALGRALNNATRRLEDGTTLSTKGMFDGG